MVNSSEPAGRDFLDRIPTVLFVVLLALAAAAGMSVFGFTAAVIWFIVHPHRPIDPNNDIYAYLIVLAGLIGLISPVLFLIRARNRQRRQRGKQDSIIPSAEIARQKISPVAGTNHSSPQPYETEYASRETVQSHIQKSVAALSNDGDVSSVSDVPTAPMPNKHCQKCARQIPGDSTLCPYCGNRQQSQSESSDVRCSNCERQIPNDANLCPYCGEVAKHSFTASVLPVIEAREEVRQRRFRKSAVWIAIGCAALFYIASRVHEKTVGDFASKFVTEQLNKKGIKNYRVDSVEVPMISILESKYDVAIILQHAGDDEDKVRVLTTTITGSCLISRCVISMRGIELLGL